MASVISAATEYVTPASKTVFREVLGAIACPLTPGEVPRMLENMRTWTDNPPFSDAETKLQKFKLPRLVFSFNCKRREDLAGPLLELFESTPAIRNSFAGAEVRFCNLPPEKDKYVRGAQTREGVEYGGCAGPNWLFYETMAGLKSQVKFVFLMESDCYPIRPNWLTRLEQVCTENQDAWVIGTQYCGVSPIGLPILRHINGNALYNLGDPSYVRFLESFLWPWMHRQIRSKNISMCYDCAWESYLSSLATEASSNQARVFARRQLPRFRIKNFIVNIAGGAEIEGNYIWTKSDIQTQFPNAVLIHGPFVTNTDHVQGGIALGKPVIAPGVIVEGSRLRYTGPNERGKTRFERTVWLRNKPAHPIPGESTLNLDFTLECEHSGEGVIIEFFDETRSLLARKIAINRSESSGRSRIQMECMMNVPRSFIWMTLRFFGVKDECCVTVSETSLEIRDADSTVLASTDRIF